MAGARKDGARPVSFNGGPASYFRPGSGRGYETRSNGEMKNISERKQFETLTEAQAWVKTYDCAGHIISVHNGSDWVPYIVSADGKLSPVNAGDISVGDVKVIDGGAANGIQ